MTDNVSQLCKEYGYPAEIENYLHLACDEFKVISPSSINLIGSTARGEFSWLDREEKKEPLSDFEFAIMTEKQLSQEKKNQLQLRLLDLASTIPHTNPHFHIDWAIMDRRKLSRISHNLAIFEMKALGKTLVGDESDLEQLPEVSISNIDFRALDQLVLMRLWWLLAGIPKEVVRSSASQYELLIFQYVSCRNFLEIPTILLPHEGVLIAGFSARAQYIQDNHSFLKSSRYFDERFPHAVSRAVAEKQTLKYELSETQEYFQALNGYVQLLRFLLGTQPDYPLEKLCDLIAYSSTKFDSPPISRQRARNFMKRGQRWLRVPSLSGARALGRASEGTLIAVLLGLHHALLKLRFGEKLEARAWLTRSQDYLSILYPQLTLSLGPLEESWLLFRRIVAEAMFDSFSTLERRSTFANRLLEWADRDGIQDG